MEGQASEASQQVGAQPSSVTAPDWLKPLPVHADFAKWVDGTMYRYLLQYAPSHTQLSTS
jgi:hypothetical protein